MLETFFKRRITLINVTLVQDRDTLSMLCV